MYALADIANRFGLELRGDATAGIVGVNTLAEAGPDQIGFLANPAYRAQLATTRAAAVVLSDKDAHAATGSVLVSRNPYADFARITALFERREPVTPGIHPSAVVAGDAVIDPNAQVAAHCVIGARSRIAAGAVLGPACVIGEDCVIGPEARLVARVTLVVRVRIGARVLIHPGAVLGAAGHQVRVMAAQVDRRQRAHGALRSHAAGQPMRRHAHAHAALHHRQQTPPADDERRQAAALPQRLQRGVEMVEHGGWTQRFAEDPAR